MPEYYVYLLLQTFRKLVFAPVRFDISVFINLAILIFAIELYYFIRK